MRAHSAVSCCWPGECRAERGKRHSARGILEPAIQLPIPRLAIPVVQLQLAP